MIFLQCFNLILGHAGLDRNCVEGSVQVAGGLNGLVQRSHFLIDAASGGGCVCCGCVSDRLIINCGSGGCLLRVAQRVLHVVEPLVQRVDGDLVFSRDRFPGLALEMTLQKPFRRLFSLLLHYRRQQNG